jgi:hypothetical protein
LNAWTFKTQDEKVSAIKQLIKDGMTTFEAFSLNMLLINEGQKKKKAYQNVGLDEGKAERLTFLWFKGYVTDLSNDEDAEYINLFKECVALYIQKKNDLRRDYGLEQ